MSELLKNVYDVTNITTMGDYPSKTDKSIIIYATDDIVYFQFFGERDNAGRSNFKCMLPTLYEAYKKYFCKDKVDEKLVENVGYIAEKSLWGNHEAMWHKCLYISFTPQGEYKNWVYDSLKADVEINISGKVKERIFQTIEDNTHPYIRKVEEDIYDARNSKYVSDDMLLLDKKSVSVVLFNDPETKDASYYIALNKIGGKTYDEQFQSLVNTLKPFCCEGREIALPNRERFFEESYLFIYSNRKASYSNINAYISNYRKLATQSKGVANC